MRPNKPFFASELPCESPQGLTRILLSQAASDALTAAGEGAFVIFHRAMRGTEEPGSAGRWCLHLAPVSHETASDACEVLLGRKKAIKRRKLNS